jgi:hypothetical protein
MKTKRKRGAVGILLMALMAFSWQCTSWFSSATLHLTYFVEKAIHSVDEKVERATVDLTENDDWQEHHDDVEGISRVLFAFWVKNLSAVDATAQFYISTDSALVTAEEVADGATLVLDGVHVPANDSVYVTPQNSYKDLQHVDELKERLIEGRFSLYLLADHVPFEIEVPDSAALVIEFTYAVDWEF